MKYIKIVSLLAMIITAFAVMSSCEKDEANSKDLYAYTTLHRIVKDFSLTSKYQPDGTVLIEDAAKQTSAKFAFAVGLTRPAVKNTQINIAFDESLLEQYNESNKTNLVFIEPSAVSLESNGSVYLPQGEVVLYDTVRIDFSKLKAGRNYLLAVNVKSVNSSDKGIVISRNSSAIFVVVKTAICKNIDTSPGSPTGEIIARTSWNVTASDVNNEATGAVNMVDGKNDTFWLSTPTVLSSIMLDCGEEKSISAFKLTTITGESYSYSPKTISIAGSSDNEIWDEYGVSPTLYRSLSTTLPEDAEVNYIRVLHPQKYRYYRLKIESHYVPATGSGIAELDAME